MSTHVRSFYGSETLEGFDQSKSSSAFRDTVTDNLFTKFDELKPCV